MTSVGIFCSLFSVSVCHSAVLQSLYTAKQISHLCLKEYFILHFMHADKGLRVRENGRGMRRCRSASANLLGNVSLPTCMSAFYALRIRPAINHASRIGTCARRNYTLPLLPQPFFMPHLSVTLATNTLFDERKGGKSFASAPPFLSPSLIISCRMWWSQPHCLLFLMPCKRH